MKSLVLKDFYNIGHNAKALACSLIFGLLVFGRFSNLSFVACYCCMICSMLTVTTFSYDRCSRWTQYALVMPVSKRELVASKFIVMALFTGIGALAGGLSALGWALYQGAALRTGLLLTILALMLLTFSFCQMATGLCIPLLFRFGTENTRILSVLASVLLLVLYNAAFYPFLALGLDLNAPATLLALACGAFILAQVWNFCMYRLSFRIFARTDLSRIDL